jgi:hypothetical protein
MHPIDKPASARRRGCTGCLAQTALGLAFGCTVLYLIYALLAPWNFYFGGHFHLVPGWTGRGWMHSTAAGGDYYLCVRFEPTTPGYRKSPLQGVAYLCTPRGEKFRLHFGGGMPPNHGTDLRGFPIHLYMNNWALGAQFTGDRRPQLDLYGTFGDSQLILEDRGSLARAFRPDGTLHEPRDRNRPWQQESAHVTLQEDSSWGLSTSCPATPK